MLVSILEQTLIAMPLLMGAYLTLSLLKLPDFSIESAYLFGAVLAFATKSFSFPLILFSSFLGGMCVGFVVSMLNQYLQIPFLLAAIITNGIFHGLSQYLLKAAIVSLPRSEAISDIILFGVVGASLLFTLGMCMRSQLGYSLAIYGNNPKFFSHHGISGRYVLICGVMIGHGCAGISGFFFAYANGFIDISMNFGLLLMCLMALLFGRLIIHKRNGTLLIPVVGLLGYFLMQQILVRIGLNLKFFNAFQAIFILTALLVGRRKRFVIDHLGV